MTGYTPGPWAVKHGKWITAIRGDHEGEIIAGPTYWMEDAPEEAAANARLIAASPDLLAALKMLHDNIAEYAALNHLGGFDNQDMRNARAAIAKATGAAQ